MRIAANTAAGFALVIAGVLGACSGEPERQSTPPPAVDPVDPAASVAAVPAPAAPEPVVELPEGWRWEEASSCLGAVDLPIPPGATLNDIRTSDGCIVGVQRSQQSMVNVHPGSRSLAETRDGIGRSWDVTAVLVERVTPNGWIYAVDVVGPSPMTYTARDDLDITCIAMTTDVELVTRICADARARR